MVITDTISMDSLALTAVSDSLLRHLTPAPKKEQFVPDPIRATWVALVFPGGGQIYNRKYWKLPIVYGGFLGCTYALTWNNMMLHDYQQAYLDIMDTDPNTKSYEKMLPIGYDITGREERFKNIFKNKKNHFRKYRDMSIFAFAGVYLISIIDAYVDAELSSFDISTDLHRRVAARQLRTSLLTYMRSMAFHPTTEIALNTVQNLFEKVAPPANLFTKDSPDELKPALKP